jgi:hypothetical protein
VLCCMTSVGTLQMTIKLVAERIGMASRSQCISIAWSRLELWKRLSGTGTQTLFVILIFRSCQKTWLSRVVVDKKAAKRRLNEEDLVLFDNVETTQETWHRSCMQDRVVQALAMNREQMGLIAGNLP